MKNIINNEQDTREYIKKYTTTNPNKTQKRNAIAQIEQDLHDQSMDAMHELHVYKQYIEERLELHRRHIADFVDDEYDETIMARYDELTKLKYYVNNNL